jgi:hypothetical protein
MKSIQHTTVSRIVIAAAVCLASSGLAQAKGYSPSRAASSAESRQFEKRLARVEDHQKRMEEALTAELSKLRAELDHAKAERMAKTGTDSTE